LFVSAKRIEAQVEQSSVIAIRNSREPSGCAIRRKMTHFQIRQCLAGACRFRFPWTENDPPALRCPRCGAPVQIVYTGDQRPEQQLAAQAAPIAETPPVHALLDNVRSAFNVGSIFRSADGAQVHHLYLCGITPTPHHAKVAKTALGAELATPWSYHKNALDLARDLRDRGYRLWALEDAAQAEPIFKAPGLQADTPVVIIVGNEVAGVDPALLALCERVLAIPMWGAKRSLNVAIAFGIAIYGLRLFLQPN
jgi:tRNA G18 (ribose-2'-O)-methylase SpoU